MLIGGAAFEALLCPVCPSINKTIYPNIVVSRVCFPAQSLSLLYVSFASLFYLICEFPSSLSGWRAVVHGLLFKLLSLF